jgi:preprotein translocase subunit SecA
MQKLGMQEGEAIEHPWVTRAIENAQRKVEGRNFDIRKQLLEYDDVANDQRKVIYEQRNRLMDVTDISDSIRAIRTDVLGAVIGLHAPAESLPEQWNIPELEQHLEREFGATLPLSEWLKSDAALDETVLRGRIVAEFENRHAEKEAAIGSEVMRHLEKAVMLQVVDAQWKDHLAAMDYLRQGIHLRGYAQKNPKEEYKREAFEMFSAMLDRIKHEVIALLARVQVQHAESDVEALESQQRPPQEMHFLHPSAQGAQPEEPGEVAVAEAPKPVRREPKVGRNEPCPCGSGKKYKHCHGKLQ